MLQHELEVVWKYKVETTNFNLCLSLSLFFSSSLMQIENYLDFYNWICIKNKNNFIEV